MKSDFSECFSKRGLRDQYFDYGGEWNSTSFFSVIIEGAAEKVYKVLKPVSKGIFSECFSKRSKWDKNFEHGGPIENHIFLFLVIIEGIAEKVYKVLKPVLKGIFLNASQKWQMGQKI